MSKKFKFPQRSFEYYKKIGPKEFCRQFLFPVMEREHGTGFAMQNWSYDVQPGSVVNKDGLTRVAPDCGTMCCIGGTIQHLCIQTAELKATCELFSLNKYGELLGLDVYTTESLFYRWDMNLPRAWPEPLAQKFADAETPAEKVKIAEQMVRLAVRTKGKCFNPNFKMKGKVNAKYYA